MAVLGFLSIFGGCVQIPGVDDVIDKFLRGSFLRTRRCTSSPRRSPPTGRGSAVGGALGRARDRHRLLRLRGAGRGTTARADPALRAPSTRFLVNKWYFDELYDALVYRPVIAIGRFANAVVERVVVQGIVAGAVGAVRGVGVVVRGAQSGFVRAYALLLIGGFAALGLYFLIVSSVMGSAAVIQVMLWLPVAVGLLVLRRAAQGGAGRWRSLGIAGRARAGDRPGGRLPHRRSRASSTRSTRAGSPTSGSATSSASTGSASSWSC